MKSSRHREPTKLQKRKPPRRQIHHRVEEDLEGEGILDYFKPRDSYNNTSKKTLATFGGSPIVSITLSRAPIQSFLTKALDAVSFGKFSKLQQKAGFDKLFHLSMIADIEHNGARRKVVIEKNAVINISSKFKAEADAEYKSVPMKGSLNLSTMMDKTQALMGSQYFPYNAFGNNCQNFISSILKANNLLTPELQDWLFQSVDQIAAGLPGITKAIANAVTHTGAVVDKLTGGSRIDAMIKASIERVEKRRTKVLL